MTCACTCINLCLGGVRVGERVSGCMLLVSVRVVVEDDERSWVVSEGGVMMVSVGEGTVVVV